MTRLTHKEASATRNPVNGSILVSAIIGNYWVKRVYYGYTKREAIRMFCLWANTSSLTK
jgi:hypothetical protein